MKHTEIKKRSHRPRLNLLTYLLILASNHEDYKPDQIPVKLRS